jgi:5S rRNA maturation endonuclease (ribonuclease M5)
MSNVLHRNGLVYFQLPQALVKNKILPKLNGNALKLYVYLLHEAQRLTSSDLMLNAEELDAEAGISESGLRTAKRELVELKLILLTRGSNGYTYTLCDPDNGEPLASSDTRDGIFFDFDALKPDQLEKYYRCHLKEHDVRGTDNGLSARCPFHDDQRPSFSITLERGSAWQCHSCNRSGKLIAFELAIAEHDGSPIDVQQAHKQVVRILESAGVKLTKFAAPEASYDYVDEDGEVLYQVRRYPGKAFPVYRPNPEQPGDYIKGIKGVRKVLYWLPEIREAETVIVVEGERDADSIRSLHLKDAVELPIAATTNLGGAGKWQAEYADSLAGKIVIVIPDNDELGLDHASEIENSVKTVAKETRFVRLPADCKDVTDFLGKHQFSALIELIGAELFSADPVATI